MFDDADATAAAFVGYCSKNPGLVSTLVCAALAELFRGDDPEFFTSATMVVDDMIASGVESPAHPQIGASVLHGAWTVSAPFGRSVMLGFDNRFGHAPVSETDFETAEEHDVRHSVLVELDENGRLMDLQLSGAAEMMVDEADSIDGRVVVEPIDVEDGIASIIAAWPAADTPIEGHGPGIAANEQFVRHRVWKESGTLLPKIALIDRVADVRRGLDDDEFAEANRAALSTLRAALGATVDDTAGVGQESGGEPLVTARRAWVGVVRGDGGDLSGRERDALLWLEWADWLGAGIGIARAGETAEVSGAALVDHVNRCPEVSSSIDKADRDYAEWAFAVAIEVLEDAGAVMDGRLTTPGWLALIPALVEAWS